MYSFQSYRPYYYTPAPIRNPDIPVLFPQKISLYIYLYIYRSSNVMPLRASMRALRRRRRLAEIRLVVHIVPLVRRRRDRRQIQRPTRLRRVRVQVARDGIARAAEHIRSYPNTGELVQRPADAGRGVRF